jgi:hypothetical protein
MLLIKTIITILVQFTVRFLVELSKRDGIAKTVEKAKLAQIKGTV